MTEFRTWVGSGTKCVTVLDKSVLGVGFFGTCTISRGKHHLVEICSQCGRLRRRTLKRFCTSKTASTVEYTEVKYASRQP